MNLRFCAWFLSFPIPVFLYFYVKFVTAENPRFIRSDWLQALPTLFAFLYVCQLFAMDYEEKRAFIEPDNLQYIIAYKTFELLQGLAVVFYSLWSFLILWRFRNKIRDEFSNLHKKQLNWLWGLLSFSSLIGLAGVVGALIGVFRTLQLKIGEQIFYKLLVGRYRPAQEENRAFMFLDLKSSTTIAEQLGHSKYSFFIQDCFKDLHPAVLQCKAMVYQYVGDEAVLTWDSDMALQNSNCIRAFFVFDKQL
ncbi:MAG TPA: hypothetical protein VFD35_14195 [Pricia sp.]|nr:hypothetical protein [Pricia sp.]